MSVYKTDNNSTLTSSNKFVASPAISNGLDKLSVLLERQGIKVANYDELYNAAICICRFVGAKERRAIESNFNKETK